MIWIFTALAAEARAVRHAVDKLDVAAQPLYAIRLIGIGAVTLRRPADAQIPVGGVTRTGGSATPEGIILAGFAGALDAGLRVGDIVLDAPDVSAAAATAQFISSKLPSARIASGRVVTATAVISTVADKLLLREQTGAVAVDMEQATVQNYAQQLGAAFLAVRAISDTANETLPLDVLRCVNSFGRVRPVALAACIGRRPGMVADLTRLGRNAAKAGAALTDALAAVLRSGWPAQKN